MNKFASRPGAFFGLVIFLAAFLLLVFPVRSIQYTAAEVAQNRQVNHLAFHSVERDTKGGSYVWSRPVAQFYFNDVPRYGALHFQIELNLNRPANIPAARIEFNEIRNGQHRPLGQVQLNPADLAAKNLLDPGYRRYDFVVPPCLECETGALIEMKSNGFQPNNDPRELGVLVQAYRIQGAGPLWVDLLWPRPLLLGLILFGLGLSNWGCQLKLSRRVMLILLLPVAFYLAVLHTALFQYWPWLLICGLGLNLTALGWARASRRRPYPVGWLVAGSGFALAFMCFSPHYGYDAGLFLGWISDIRRNPTGPFDIYHHSTRLDYPPLIAYFFWVYGTLSSWLKLSQNVLALKFFFILAGPALVGLIVAYRFQFAIIKNSLSRSFLTFGSERYLLRGVAELEKSWDVQGLYLLAFGVAPAFDMAVWGQTDLAACLLIGAVMVSISQNWAGRAGILLGLAIIFKPQCWLIAPFLVFLLLLRFGWKRTIGAGLVGSLIALLLAVPAFGFDLQALLNFWLQPELAGNLTKGSMGAFNLVYLLGYGDKAAPNWAVYGGFGVVAAVFCTVLGLTWQRQRLKRYRHRLEEFGWQAFGAALIFGAFFLFAVKMHERYLVYGLVFLAIAALSYRPLFVPCALLNFSGLLNILVTFFGPRRDKLPDTFFLWQPILQQPALPGVISFITLVGFGWLVFLFCKGPSPRQEFNLENESERSAREVPEVVLSPAER